MKQIHITLGSSTRYRKWSLRMVKKTWDWNIFEMLLYVIGLSGVLYVLITFAIHVEINTDIDIERGVNPVSPPTVQAVEEVKEQPLPPVKVAEVVKPYAGVVEYIQNRVSNSPMDEAYVAELYRASGEDLYLTKLAVAIAFAETSLGTHPAVNQKTNFMGYDAPNGYDPEDVGVFADRLMRGLEYYRGVESNRVLAATYTGADRVDTWMYAVNEALSGIHKLTK